MKRVAVVTGGTSGIGLEIVRTLAEAGFVVRTCGSRENPPPEIQELADVEYLSCNLANHTGRSALVDWLKSDPSSLEFLFNNAGIQNECQIAPGLDRCEVEREIAINLCTPILLCASLAPQLAGARGCVVNISSGLALAPKAASPIYCATKAGLSSFSRTLRYQFKPLGIRVVDVLTPLVRTPMTAGRHEGAMDPKEFCRELWDKIRSGKDEVYVGRTKWLPWALRFAPARARKFMLDA